ncbi:DNA methylase N-4/N-6 domain protein [Acidithiobacillus ferrivorans SS3]|uniref:site-specific DNA-methyltransferase (adenine-specific) n=1 Tax=Acidithiobacillus ferrivorans SS3 TaxID=743299 RepID=G0JLM3_9PROT|nr:site-specific DNA-methyltransferase [Acidithiobacillus ferrivorans]AEM48072.1 DNA methylase N-4/N-6 domain protein [Acidithiobacillus ferrivorans SS3]
MTDTDKLNLQSLNIPEEKREDLLRIFPEIRTEGGQIDFDRLRLALGDMVDTGKERYGLNWPGKSACFKAIQTPSMGTLLPEPEESVNFDTTENLIIEGDNLEALKLLQKSYIGKVKMIYIDPPYNTGNDFIYPDNYSESLQTYLEYTGQTGEEGKRFSSNTDTDGRFHSKWLNMMYPRLYLARDLLRDDGVVFISIDDHEADNLYKLGKEIFGEENFVASISVQINPRGRHLDSFVAKTHEYVMIFAKDASNADCMFGIEKSDRWIDEYDKCDERGRYRELGLRNRNQAFNPITRPTLFYPIFVNPHSGDVDVVSSNFNSVEVLPVTADGVKTCWTWGKIKVANEKSLLTAKQVSDGTWRVFRKDYLEKIDGSIATTLPKSLWVEKEMNNDYGRRSLQELLGDSIVEFPKSPFLINKIVEVGMGKDGLVLDFFAGSGTTAHAVLDLNKQDGGNRKLILVQLPEPTDRTDYPTIAEITKERVRRVIKKLNDEDGNEKNQDRGFRVFKLAESNFTPWDGSIDQTQEDISRQMEMHIEHVRQGRTDEDILYEILLKSGFPLSIPVETMQVDGKTLYSIHDGIMLVCLDRNLTMPLVQAIVDRLPERVVFLDEGFAGNDALKVNAKEACKLKNIVFKVV